MSIQFASVPAASSIWLVVDANTDNYERLLEGVITGTTTFVLDPDRDGIAQITELFQAATVPPHTLHIISHGSPGTLYLGNRALSLGSLRAYASQLSNWSVQNLLLYGCNVAVGDAGEEFLGQLSALTGAAVAASTTPVGDARQGGNWYLDTQIGTISAAAAISPSTLQQYTGILAALPDVSTLFSINGDAVRTAADEIFLAPDITSQSGSAYSRARIDFSLNWDFTFDIFLGDDNDGADGIGFVLHNDPAGSAVTSGEGGALGVAGVSNSIAIEFDTFQNELFGDPAQDHTAIILNADTGLLDHDDPGNEDFVLLGDIEDNAFHRVFVSWEASTNTLSYSFDGTEIDSITRDIINLEFGGEDLIFWGFGASTGARTNDHFVRLIDFNGRLVEEDSDTEIPLPEPEKISSGPIVFQFKQFVQFEAIDEKVPYRGDQAAFDEGIYLLANPGVRAAVVNGTFESGFDHYEQLGREEGRSTLSLNVEVGGIRMSSLYDETYYLDQNPGVAEAVRNGDFVYGYHHFLAFGLEEGRNPSLYYDEDLYLQENAGVEAAVLAGDFDSGLEHYLLFGHIENRRGSTLFDPEDYLLSNPGVAAAVANGDFESGFDHYLEFGASEGRGSTLLFEESFYLDQNPGVKAAVANGNFTSGFEHYVTFGQSESRDPSPLFDESEYLDCNPGVVAAINAGEFSSGMEHFFRFGRQEGRIAVAVA